MLIRVCTIMLVAYRAVRVCTIMLVAYRAVFVIEFGRPATDCPQTQFIGVSVQTRPHLRGEATVG